MTFARVGETIVLRKVVKAGSPSINEAAYSLRIAGMGTERFIAGSNIAFTVVQPVAPTDTAKGSDGYIQIALTIESSYNDGVHVFSLEEYVISEGHGWSKSVGTAVVTIEKVMPEYVVW